MNWSLQSIGMLGIGMKGSDISKDMKKLRITLMCFLNCSSQNNCVSHKTIIGSCLAVSSSLNYINTYLYISLIQYLFVCKCGRINKFNDPTLYLLLATRIHRTVALSKMCQRAACTWFTGLIHG